jgi:hypothetical protein
MVILTKPAKMLESSNPHLSLLVNFTHTLTNKLSNAQQKNNTVASDSQVP